MLKYSKMTVWNASVKVKFSLENNFLNELHAKSTISLISSIHLLSTFICVLEYSFWNSYWKFGFKGPWAQKIIMEHKILFTKVLKIKLSCPIIRISLLRASQIIWKNFTYTYLDIFIIWHKKWNHNIRF